jgi:CubicO group peptidase (beta-lactamase class C family)
LILDTRYFTMNEKVQSMSIKKFLFPALLVGSVAALIHRLFVRAFTKPAMAKPVTDGGSYEEIDAYIEGQMRRLKIPGASLAIVEDDKIVHLRGFGKARPGGEAPTPQTPFFIGSLTKSLTALAVMQLVEAGKVELDETVQRYLPWFRVADPQASAQMTVRHLLNQTSGLPMMLGMADLANLDSRPDAAEHQMRALSTLKLTRPVGSRFEYANANYNVLGLIIETASGESYSNYVQRHIFDPLDMSHSYSSQAEAKQNGLAMGHRYWFGHPFPATTLAIPPGSLPSGQLISSAEDMAHYLIAHLNGGCYGDAKILSPAGIDEMHRPAAEINEMGMSLGYYGMGWINQGTGEKRIVWHSGIVPDFGAFMALAPEQKKGFVLLFNANHAMMKMTFDEMGIGAAQRLAGEMPPPHRLGAALWAMRGMLLIPVIQFITIVGTLRKLRRWRIEPERRPSRERLWGRHILLPLIPNLSIALALIPMLSRMRGFINLFMPDFSWIAMIFGSISLVWSFLRTGLVLRALRGSSSSQSVVE